MFWPLIDSCRAFHDCMHPSMQLPHWCFHMHACDVRLGLRLTGIHITTLTITATHLKWYQCAVSGEQHTVLVNICLVCDPHGIVFQTDGS
jgi:hypothetical protein